MAMLSTKLVALVEDHWEQITAQVIHLIRHDLEFVHLKHFPETELRESGRRTFKYLGRWLDTASDTDLIHHYEEAGRNWKRGGIPIHEIVRAVQIFHSRMIDFIREQGLARTSIDVYAEEELEHRVDRFFDNLVYHIVKGCETDATVTTSLHAPDSRAR